MVKETPLLGDKLGKVETLEVRADMHAEPLVARTGPHEAFDIAAQMQARPRPNCLPTAAALLCAPDGATVPCTRRHPGDDRGDRGHVRRDCPAAPRRLSHRLWCARRFRDRESGSSRCRSDSAGPALDTTRSGTGC